MNDEHLAELERKFSEFGLGSAEERDRFARLAQFGASEPDRRLYVVRLSMSTEIPTASDLGSTDAELA